MKSKNEIPILQKTRNKRILNVGCGNDTYGTDFVDLYPSRPEVIKCNMDVEKIPFPDNYFDEVYSKYTFEHLINPLNFLKESFRVLKKGGKIIIVTDNAGLYGLFGNAHYGEYEKLGKHGVKDRHYHLFTTQHMKNWLDIVGFKDIYMTYEIGKKYTKHTLKNYIILKILTFISKKLSPYILVTAKKLG